ncbi:MAG: LysR substrate-binding domain-containing protein, partial [Eubacteriales bacterium]|nr:LysR substrate-binding domain-containing protein [Eubacteriales bacterium]
QLLDRSQKKITLTSEGKVFLKRVEGILANIEDAVIEMQDYQGLAKGMIKLGVPPMIGSFIFPEIFAGFRKIYPKIDFTITEEGSLAVREMLEQGDLDVGIIILREESKFLDTVIIQENQIVACLPLNHPLAESNKISFDDLRYEKFIMLKEDTFHRRAVIEACENSGYYPEIAISSSQTETIRALVANGLGISFLLDSIAERKKDLVGIPLENPIKINIALAWKKDKYLSVATQTLIDFIKNNFAGKVKL